MLNAGAVPKGNAATGSQYLEEFYVEAAPTEGGALLAKFMAPLVQVPAPAYPPQRTELHVWPVEESPIVEETPDRTVEQYICQSLDTLLPESAPDMINADAVPKDDATNGLQYLGEFYSETAPTEGGALVAMFMAPPVPAPAPVYPPSSSPRPGHIRDINNLVTSIGGKLDLKCALDVQLTDSDITRPPGAPSAGSSQKDPTGVAFPTIPPPPGAACGCTVRIEKRWIEKPLAQRFPKVTLEEKIAHELCHCKQFEMGVSPTPPPGMTLEESADQCAYAILFPDKCPFPASLEPTPIPAPKPTQPGKRPHR